MAFVLFFGGIFLIALLFVFVQKGLRKKNGGNALNTKQEFDRMVRDNVTGLIPQAKDFDIVIGVGINDNVASLKGYEKLQTGYGSLPYYIICYRGDEIYLTSVEHASKKSMDPDKNFMIHMTTDNVAKVDIGMMGKVSVYFKEGKKFIVMNVTETVFTGMLQKEECQKFRNYIKEFAAKVG